MQINYYDITGKKLGEKEIKTTEIKEGIDTILLRYIKVYLFNQHQGTASTKTRAEVSGGGKKPHTQKHTGRARAGSSRSPIWVGGGIAHGPRPKDVSRTMPKNWKKDAFKLSILSKINDSALCLIDFTPVQNPNTKQVSGLIQSLGGKSSLIIHDNNKNIFLSSRNILNANVCDVSNVNPLDVVNAGIVLVEEAALEKLEGRL